MPWWQVFTLSLTHSCSGWDSGREKGSEGEAGTQGDGGLHGIWVFLDAA